MVRVGSKRKNGFVGMSNSNPNNGVYGKKIELNMSMVFLISK